ncbi:hypothetical protein HZC07_03405 [Candidatus Micrarchaeota archaeon]|nr:hypothetical protein [Candidatus Micrarchaeota archaeon]
MEAANMLMRMGGTTIELPNKTLKTAKEKLAEADYLMDRFEEGWEMKGVDELRVFEIATKKGILRVEVIETKENEQAIARMEADIEEGKIIQASKRAVNLPGIVGITITTGKEKEVIANFDKPDGITSITEV